MRRLVSTSLAAATASTRPSHHHRVWQSAGVQQPQQQQQQPEPAPSPSDYYYTFDSPNAALTPAQARQVLGRMVVVRSSDGVARFKKACDEGVRRVGSLDGDNAAVPQDLLLAHKLLNDADGAMPRVPVVAGPQLSHARRILYLNDEAADSGTLVCDPVVTYRSPQQVTTWETCPCLPGLVFRTARSASLSLDFWSSDPMHTLSLDNAGGRKALALQRGLDYLEGRLLPTRTFGEDAVVSLDDFVAKQEEYNAEVDVAYEPFATAL
eukprot:Rhum_TRINITY_DN11277_c0_g1::Rhum_TRINITY_DN11277_c0_g1_i1::g.43662::m.43662